MSQLHTLDYFAIIVYMLLMVGIGVFLGKYIKNINDYFKGGSGVSWVAGGISNFMTKFSTFVFVAYAGIAYSDGLVSIIIIWSTIFPSLLAVLIYAKRWKRAGIVSPVEYLETRFNAPIRQIFSWGGVFTKVLDDMVKLYSIGLFVTAVAGVPFETAVIVCGVVVSIYTVIGGFWAVIVTDVIQFVILFFATLILVPLSYEAAGGWSNMQATMPENMQLLNGSKGTLSYLAVYYLMIMIKYNGNWTFIQRFYSAKTEEDGKKIGWLSAFLFLLFPVIFLFPPIAAKVIIPNLENPEMAYVALCLKLLPQGILGLMISAMFAATMSVLSAEYNVTASVLTRDIYQRIFRKNASSKETLWVARIMTLVVGLIVTVGALYVNKLGGAFKTNQYLTGVFSIPMIIPVILGVVFWRPQPWGAIATLIVGIGTGIALNLNPSLDWQTATFIEIVICTAVFMMSGLFLSSDTEYNSRVSRFFEKLKQPTVLAADDDKGGIQGLMKLYAFAFLVTAIMFITMSYPSIGQQSGILAFGAGIICLVLAVGFYINGKPKSI
jgi:SSS family transporter